MVHTMVYCSGCEGLSYGTQKRFLYDSSAVDRFSNPEVFAVIAKLRYAEIRFRPFSESRNSGDALAPPAPLLSTPLDSAHLIETSDKGQKISE